MKAARFCLLLWLVTANATASTLEEVESSLAAFETLRSDFYQTRYMSGLPSPLESSGHLLLDKEKGLAWVQTVPFEVSYVFTNDQFATNFPGQPAKVTRKNENPQLFQLRDLIAKVVSGNNQGLEKYFDIQFESLGSASWKMILAPKNARLKKLFRSIQLQGRTLIEQVNVYEASGNRTVIRFVNITTGPTLRNDEEDFLFPN